MSDWFDTIINNKLPDEIWRKIRLYIGHDTAVIMKKSFFFTRKTIVYRGLKHVGATEVSNPTLKNDIMNIIIDLFELENFLRNS